MLAATALTQAAAASAEGSPPIVRVYVAGPPEAVSGSRDAIQDLCARSNVAVVVRDAAGADEALLAQSPAPGLAEAYVDLRPGTAPRVVIVDSETRKDLERRTLPEDASLEISIETMAQVVCAAVESSLAARAIPPPPPPLPLPSPLPPAPPLTHEQRAGTAPPPAPDRGSEWASRIGLFAEAANFGVGFRAGTGAAFGITHGKSALRWGAQLSVAGYPATDVEGAGGVASFGLFGARLLPTLEWSASHGVTAFAGLGGGADWIRIAAEQPPPGTVGQATAVSFDAIASGILGVRLHLGGGVAALLAADADADLSRHRYVIQSARGSQSFFDPTRVRPVLLVGLSIPLVAGGGANPHNEARR